MFKQKFWLIIFVLLEMLSALMVSIGVWPQSVVFLQFIPILLVLVYFDLEYALYTVILSIPFFLVIPNSRFDSFSLWRIAIAGMFLAFLFKARIRNLKDIKTMPWDKYLLGFIIIAAISLLVAEFKFVGIKKIAFVFNIYLLYLVVLNVIRSKAQFFRALTVTFASLGLVMAIGVVQFIFTFKTSLWDFWQYWATYVSRAYYGPTLANSEVYSNSWFNFVKNQPMSLRMFSILPDSHAFGVIAMFAVLCTSVMLVLAKRKFADKEISSKNYRYYSVLLWIAMIISIFSIVLSGTRGIWAAAVIPAGFVIYFIAKKIGKKLLFPILIPFLIFFLLVGTSPLTQKALSSVHAGDISSRFASIYDLQDQGNQGRIFIWKNTLKYFGHHPFLGTGFGNFIVTLKGAVLPDVQQYQQLSDATEGTFNLPGKYITAHNLYLDVLAEVGILGFIFFALWLWHMAKSFFAFFKKHYLFHDDAYVFFVVSAGLYMLWLFVYSLFDGTLINDRTLMYFFILLALSAGVMKNYEHT